MDHREEGTVVDVRFEEDGSVRPRRFKWDQTWMDVLDVGRQWVDTQGRHVLVMVPGQLVFELLMVRETLTWHVARAPDPRHMA